MSIDSPAPSESPSMLLRRPGFKHEQVGFLVVVVHFLL